jgi:hypothetical protein
MRLSCYQHCGSEGRLSTTQLHMSALPWRAPTRHSVGRCRPEPASTPSSTLLLRVLSSRPSPCRAMTSTALNGWWCGSCRPLPVRPPSLPQADQGACLKKRNKQTTGRCHNMMHPRHRLFVCPGHHPPRFVCLTHQLHTLRRRDVARAGKGRVPEEVGRTFGPTEKSSASRPMRQM